MMVRQQIQATAHLRNDASMRGCIKKLKNCQIRASIPVRIDTDCCYSSGGTPITAALE